MTEIGSIYEIDPQAVGANRAEAVSRADAGKALRLRQVSKYHKKYGVFTASGREAIALCLKSLEKERPELPKRCLLPAYMCDSVFFPFLRAHFALSFYPVGKNLEADRDALCAQLEKIRPGLLFIHAYYGMDTWKPMRPLLTEWREKGLCVMEDVTQSYYLTGTGKEADYVVGSLRKWYAAPDGGFALSDMPLPAHELLSGVQDAEERLKVLTGKWDYLHGVKGTSEAAAHKEAYLKKNRELEMRLDEQEKIRALSPAAAGLLNGANEERCRDRRRENCRILAEGLRGAGAYVPALSFEGTLAAPLYFPVYAKQREKLQEHLRQRDIYAPVLWPVGEANRESLSESDRYLFGHLLALPLDQRYGKTEMERIVKAMKDFDGLL